MMSNPIKNFGGRVVNTLLVSVVAVAWSVSTSENSVAAPITVPNFSFEGSALPSPGGFDAAPIPDWDVTGTFTNGGAYNSPDAQYTGATAGPLPAPADEDHFALLNATRGASAGNQFGSFTSAVSLGTVQSDSLYTLTVAAGNRKGSDFGDELTFEFLVNDVVVPASSLTVLGNTIPDDSFVDFTTSFTTALTGDPLVGGTLKVRLTHSTLAGTGIATGDFDNVRVDVLSDLTQPVPEPSAFCLLGLGMLFLRKRTKGRK